MFTPESVGQGSCDKNEHATQTDLCPEGIIHIALVLGKSPKFLDAHAMFSYPAVLWVLTEEQSN